MARCLRERRYHFGRNSGTTLVCIRSPWLQCLPAGPQGLKLGTHSHSSSPATLVTQLEKSSRSIGKLINHHIGTGLSAHGQALRPCRGYIIQSPCHWGSQCWQIYLRQRHLGRSVMPVDQQPCTTAFCEVHVVKDGVTYDLSDESTFARASPSDLDEIVSKNEDGQLILKVYLSDPCSPGPSFLRDGVVGISPIGAPGLNRDSVKTTTVFDRRSRSRRPCSLRRFRFHNQPPLRTQIIQESRVGPPRLCFDEEGASQVKAATGFHLPHLTAIGCQFPHQCQCDCRPIRGHQA